jgi:epoxyqueuosine reductase
MRDNPVRVVALMGRRFGFMVTGILNRADAVFGDWIGDWLQRGCQAEMAWLSENRSLRRDPCGIIPNGKAVISLGFPYYTPSPAEWGDRNPISRFAWGKDYHTVIKARLKQVLLQLKAWVPSLEGRCFVDTAPIPEKIIAARCGLGWVGKNGLLINPDYGSFMFLGEIVCNLDLPTTPPLADRCGHCRLCIEVCPTAAIGEDRSIDARRCISYLTVEKRGDFTPAERAAIDYQWFGCDRCQVVCPFNQKLSSDPDSPFRCFERWRKIDVERLAVMTAVEFETLKIGSPVKRAGLEGLRRNADAVLARSGRSV